MVLGSICFKENVSYTFFKLKTSFPSLEYISKVSIHLPPHPENIDSRISLLNLLTNNLDRNIIKYF
jgi:hypothetical protein